MMLPQIAEFFEGVKGRRCWSVIGGAGAGSVVSLRFGEKVRAKHPISNRYLSLEERLYEGERSLIIYCDWRVERNGVIVSTSHTTLDDGAINLDALLTVKDQSVTRIDFASNVHDLRMEFENGIVVAVFCNLSPDESDSNYVMFNPQTSVAVTTSGGLLVEAR